MNFTKFKIIILVSVLIFLQNYCLFSQDIINEELEINRRYLFNFSKETDVKLNDNMKKLLNQMILKLLDNKSNYRIKIDAHSSSNKLKDIQLQKISDDRANNALKYLLSQKVPKAKILSRGFSNRMPIQEGNSIEAINKNNRIEFMITDR